MQNTTIYALDMSCFTAEDLKQLLASKKAIDACERDALRNSYVSLRNVTVDTLTDNAIRISSVLSTFKEVAFDDLRTLHELLKECSKRHQEGKGNFMILNAAGTRKIVFKRKYKGDNNEINYITFYRKDVKNKWHLINLNFANL